MISPCDSVQIKYFAIVSEPFPSSFKFNIKENFWLSDNIRCLEIITIHVFSGLANEWREKQFSGIYQMIEIVNDRPAYKVSYDFLTSYFINFTFAINLLK